MKIYDPLSNENYVRFALAHYQNPTCRSSEELTADLENTPKYIKRLLFKYHKGGELRERLIANHIIVFTNIFGNIPGTLLLFHKIEPEVHYLLLPFLRKLQIIPPNFQISRINFDEFDKDEFLEQRLGELAS